MKLLISVTILLLQLALAAGAEPIRASSVTWSEQFGSSDADKHTTFCLMARGFFRSPHKNIQAVMDVWLKKHPEAIVVHVSSMPFRDNDPESKLTFVWVINGDETLNLELVRQGCFHPATQTIGDKQKLKVSQADYDAFTKKVAAAGEFACEQKLGIWNEPEEYESDD